MALGTNSSTHQHIKHRARTLFVLCRILPLLGIPCGLIAQTADLRDLDLEDLMRLRVTSVAKKEQSLSRAGAAIFVITQEDIRRSGMTSIPDLLRLAPGVDVARVDANAWAITIRGFSNRYSNKVLVLVDGRTVFNPAFSGVFWDQQGVPLEDIDRIEVIRGPGGTVWGANAVNGIINITTKRAQDTPGGLLSAETGSKDRAQGLVQYGGSAGAKGAYRVFGRYTRVESSIFPDRSPAADGWHSSQLGFRSDWALSPQDEVTVQGEFFGASEGQTVSTLFSNQLPTLYTFDDKVRVGNENLLGRWNHKLANGSETTVQLYYDRSRRFDEALELLHTGDVDFQYHFQAGSRHDIVTGGGYRLSDHSIQAGYAIAFGSGHRSDNLFSTFLQDEIALNKSLSLIIGSKFEHNAYTGFEYEPSVQLVWAAADRHTLWASASKAVQQPSWYLAEVGIDYTTIPLAGGGFALYQLNGNPGTRAARLLDYEIGYRTRVSRRLTLDATGFLSCYRYLPTMEPRKPILTLEPSPPHVVLPNTWENLGQARNPGAELSAQWSPTSWWRISPGFSFLKMNLSLQPASGDVFLLATAGDSPRYQTQLRSTMNLPRHIEWDTSAFYVGSLDHGPVPSYTRVDSRLGWRAGEFMEVSIAGQNLLAPHRVEFLNSFQVHPTLVQRSVVGKLTWRF
jgi:Outer membrane receptor for ferrienterochelin and colicins